MLKTICVDLDGVLAQYDGWHGIGIIGDPIPGARSFVEAIRALPARVCIYTSRTNAIAQKESGLDQRELRLLVEDWLVLHEIPYDSIACSEGKPLAVAYVDDRAVVCRPGKDIENQDYDTALRMCCALIAGHQLGSKGSYSEGCMSEDDEGDLNLMVSRSGDGIVRIDFGKPVYWLGLPKEQAAKFASIILKHARAS